jgi:transcriptional regulator with XRE-family HTH domain
VLVEESGPELFEAGAAALAGEHAVGVDARDLRALGELADAWEADLPSRVAFAFFGSLPHHLPNGIYQTVNLSLEKIPSGINLFGERLYSEMERARLKQADLANAAGCSQAAISRYLNGRIPKAAELYALSKLLGVSMEWLLMGGPDPGVSLKNTPATESRAESLEEALTSTGEKLKEILATLDALRRPESGKGKRGK